MLKFVISCSFTDFGFKKLFGEENNKELLIVFLNELLYDKQHITDITYLKNEQLPNSSLDRRAIFDLYCLNDKGERFIVMKTLGIDTTTIAQATGLSAEEIEAL